MIVDLIHGQYKSTINCPKCKRVAKAFDPFMTVQLPIPQNQRTSEHYYFLFHDMKETPIKCSYSVKKDAPIEDLRNQIAEHVKLATGKDCHPDSFVLSLIESKDLERLVCKGRSTDLLEYHRRSTLFVHQIDPRAFATHQAKESTGDEEMKDEESDEEGAVKAAEDHDDDNNGVSNEWMRVVVYFKKIDENRFYYNSKRKVSLTFPRVLWLHRDWSLKQVHMEIFSYLRETFNEYAVHVGVKGISGEDFGKLSNEEAFEYAFTGMTDENWKDLLDPEECKFSYTLGFMQQFAKKETKKQSYYSSNQAPESETLPYDPNMTVRQFMVQCYGEEGANRRNTYYFRDH